MVDVFHPPPSVIDSWPKPNYVNPQTHGPGLIVISIILSTIGIIIVSIRLYARAFVTRALGIDDALIVMATVFAIAISVLNSIGTIKYYNGHHVWDIPQYMFVPHRINIWVSEICLTMALSLTKISILLFYRRLSVSFTRTFFIAVWVGIVYNILYMISFILAICLICRPLSAFWLEFDPLYYAEHRGSCGHERNMEPLTGVFSAIGDLYTAILPMILISRLDLSSPQKRALYFLFGLGFLVVITGIIRIAYLYLMLTVTYDFTWTLWEVWVLSQVEMWVAIFVASAPALKPMIKKLCSLVGWRFSDGSHRIQEFHSSSDKYAKDTTRESVAAVADGTDSTDGFEIGKGIVMNNGVVRYAIKSRYSSSGPNTGGLRDMLSSNEAETQGRGQQWRREGLWNRVGSPDPY